MLKSLRGQRRRGQGIALIVSMIALVALIVLVSFSVDLGFVLHTRGQLQSAADSAALAAIQELRDTGSRSRAARAAEDIAREHHAGGKPVELGERDFRVGSFDYLRGQFTQGFGFGAPAVQVEARRAQDSPAGPLPLFFARMAGRRWTEVGASAVAAIRRRDLVIVRDRSQSFRQEHSAATRATRDLIRAMQRQEVERDRVGVVSFARDAIEEASLTEVVSGESFLTNTLDSIELCLPGPLLGGPCFGTDIGAGIDAARTLLERESTEGDAERIIVVVSDGVPCLPEFASEAVEQGQRAASRAAGMAGQEEISVFHVILDVGGNEGSCSGTEVVSPETLIQGFGELLTETRPGRFDELLVSVLREIPFYLVQ